jgi:hypothetical protein
MKHRSTHQQQQEQSATHAQAVQRQAAGEFATVEDALRADAAQNPVPPAVAERLQASVTREQLAAPARPWWQRWFGS